MAAVCGGDDEKSFVDPAGIKVWLLVELRGTGRGSSEESVDPARRGSIVISSWSEIPVLDVSGPQGTLVDG